MIGKLVKQSATYGVSTILGRLLSYLLTPYYTRLFTPDEYGIITDLYAIIPFALVVLTMGMESSYFRFAARADEEGGSEEEREARKKRLYSTTWGVTFFLAAVVAAIVVSHDMDVSLIMGEAYVSQPYLVSLTAGIILFDVFAAVPFARFRERGEVGRYVWLNLLNIVLQVGLAVLFGVMGLFDSPIGVAWVLIANLIASLVTFICVVSLSRPHALPTLEFSLIGRLVGYSLPLLLSGVAATATDFIDRQLIKYISPEGAMAQLGLYGAVAKIAVVMTLFTQMYRLAAEPIFLANFKKEEFLESNAAAMKFYLLATMTIFLGVTLSKDLFMYIVGGDFREGESVLPVILMSNLLMGVWLNLSFWYKREERTRYSMMITIPGLVVSVAFNFLLIPKFGYAGAAWARLLSQMAMVGYSYYLMRQNFPIPYDLRRIGEYMALGGVIYLVGSLLGLFEFELGVNLAITFVAVVIYLLYAVWREELDLMAMVRRVAFKR